MPQRNLLDVSSAAEPKSHAARSALANLLRASPAQEDHAQPRSAAHVAARAGLRRLSMHLWLCLGFSVPCFIVSGLNRGAPLDAASQPWAYALGLGCVLLAGLWGALPVHKRALDHLRSAQCDASQPTSLA